MTQETADDIGVQTAINRIVLEILMGEFLARLPELETRAILHDIAQACRALFEMVAKAGDAEVQELGRQGMAETDRLLESVRKTEALSRELLRLKRQ